MDVKNKLIFLPIFMILSGCSSGKEKSPCINMEGQYQRINSTLAIKDDRDIFFYLKHIDGTKNGFYGIIDYTDFKYSLQPVVKENSQCKIIFETVTMFYTEDRGKYGCNFVLRGNGNKSKFYCLVKSADKLPVSITKAFDKVKNEPLLSEMSEVDSMIKWNNEL